MSILNSYTRQMARQGIAILSVSILLALLVNHLRPDGLTLPGDWSDDSRVALDSGETLVVSLGEAQELFEAKQAIFLDARPRSAYESGHIRGALSLPWETFDEHFESVMGALQEDITLIAYCDGESCSLSHDLAKALVEMGFERSRVLINGWSAWRESGLPTSMGEVDGMMPAPGEHRGENRP
jgi:rhodanese-related sulfurtransferase